MRIITGSARHTPGRHRLFGWVTSDRGITGVWVRFGGRIRYVTALPGARRS